MVSIKKMECFNKIQLNFFHFSDKQVPLFNDHTMLTSIYLCQMKNVWLKYDFSTICDFSANFFVSSPLVNLMI